MDHELKENVHTVEGEKTYKIYNYMEKHHSLLIASVSAFVAFGSVATNVLIYIYQCLSLHYWNVSMELVSEVKQGKYFYVAIIGILYYCFVSIYQMHLKNIFDAHLYVFKLVKLQKKLLKKLCRYQRTKEKRQYISKQSSEIRKNLSVIKRTVLKKVFFMIIGPSVLWMGFFILFQISIGIISRYILIIGGVDLLIIISISLWFFYYIYKRDDIEELKIKVQNVGNSETTLNLLIEINDLISGISKISIKNRSFKEYFSDKSVKTFIMSLIGAYVSLFTFFVLNGLLTARTQKGFWLYQDIGGQYYAVVYQSPDKVILEEANIADNTITINVNKQFFETYQENKFEYVEFDRVERIAE